VDLFNYDHNYEKDVRIVASRTVDGYRTTLLTYLAPHGERRAAELYAPEGEEGPHPAILYVHWLAETPNANRTQFEAEAAEMAKRGAISLLVETMWTHYDWFIKRTQADDMPNSIRQVVELRAAADLLLSQPNADPRRFAYVGHDFGAMYGITMASVDPRPSHYVLMAATPRFSDWYLYYPRLEGETREAFIREMQPIDPVTLVPTLAPAPQLYQFATQDEHISDERARELADTAREPKEVRWYDADHGLNDAAAQDRIAWLTEQLGLAG
jgi:dienelactone hydrolase